MFLLSMVVVSGMLVVIMRLLGFVSLMMCVLVMLKLVGICMVLMNGDGGVCRNWFVISVM